MNNTVRIAFGKGRDMGPRAIWGKRRRRANSLADQDAGVPRMMESWIVPTFFLRNRDTASKTIAVPSALASVFPFFVSVMTASISVVKESFVKNLRTKKRYQGSLMSTRSASDTASGTIETRTGNDHGMTTKR